MRHPQTPCSTIAGAREWLAATARANRVFPMPPHAGERDESVALQRMEHVGELAISVALQRMEHVGQLAISPDEARQWCRGWPTQALVDGRPGLSRLGLAAAINAACSSWSAGARRRAAAR